MGSISAKMKAAGYLKVEQTDFLSNYVGAFQELRNAGELFDVTLACENETIEAHKVVLSACSPFFRQVFQKTKPNHPFVYLRGVLNKDLQALLQYIYTGETQVPAEDVSRFIATAQEMKIKGLVEEIEDSCSLEEKQKVQESNDGYSRNKSDVVLENTPIDLERLPIKSESLRKELRSRMEKLEGAEEGYMWRCKECGKQMKQKSKLELHVETHLEGFIHTCVLCSKDHRTRIALKTHIKIHHKDLKKESEEGSNLFVSFEELNEESFEESDGNEANMTHNSVLETSSIQSELEKEQNEKLHAEILKRMEKVDDEEQGSIWKCTECDKKLKKKNKLEAHVETHLEGFTHTCVHCNKVHKTRVALNQHIFIKHKTA